VIEAARDVDLTVVLARTQADLEGSWPRACRG
jgi:hypothetical protein